MARLDREAKERERQRILAEQRDIQKKHALERIEQLKKSELGARVVQNIDEEVTSLIMIIRNFTVTTVNPVKFVMFKFSLFFRKFTSL